MLKDLSNLIVSCREEVNAIDPTNKVSVDQSVWDAIEAFYAEDMKSGDVYIVENTLVTVSNDGQKTYISAQELPQAKAVVPYYNALLEYSRVADDLSVHMGLGQRTSKDGKSFFRTLPSADWRDTKPANEINKLEDALLAVLPDPVERNLMDRFLSDPAWSGISAGGESHGSGKKLDRGDWIESGLLKVGGWVAAGATGRWRLIKALANVPNLYTGIVSTKSASISNTALPKKAGGKNRIFYGAPGTGKTHRVNELTKSHETIRTVFHPDIQNSDFVGALKPVMDAGKITYRFSPGPFAVALANAVKNPEKFVTLIIEELNRAPAAAVFGELFLLLDRDNNGAGKYDANFPNEEFEKWFQDETGTTDTKLKLPSNFSIYATMNSADQGVYPLDTAFRRRWIQEYIEIDYAKAPTGNVLVAATPGNTVPVKWSVFVRILNEHLTRLGHIQEDRLVGPWFVNDWEIATDDRLPGKLLIYLWDDLLRHDGRSDVFATDNFGTYGGLSAALSSDEIILSGDLLAKVIAGTVAPDTINHGAS